jgi:uridine kinase
MLYILSIFFAPIHFLNLDHSYIIQNLFFKLPTLLSDILIFLILCREFPHRVRESLLFYFASQIVLYACYINSQFDLIPTSFLFLSIYLLVKRNIVVSAVVLGVALSTKFHVVAAFPLMFIFLLKNYSKRRDIVVFCMIPFVIYGFFILPYLFTPGFYTMVLAYRKQFFILDAYFSLNGIHIYICLFVIILLYGRFTIYKKTNSDLFYTFLSILFSSFVLFVKPAPGWYIWMIPFVSMFFIKFSQRSEKILPLYIGLNIAYLGYFLFCHISEYAEIIFMNHPVSFTINSFKVQNIGFTILEAVLFATVYTFYRYGVLSNAIYKKAYATVIGIGGNSAAGKTTLLYDLKQLLGSGTRDLSQDVLDIEGDGDHRWERGNEHWKDYTHLHPRANLLHRQADHLLALKTGKSIFRADYDHSTGTFTPQRKIVPGEFILLSGLHPFYLPKMRKLIDIKIFLDTDEKLRKHWKILRDSQHRGHSKREILKQIDDRADDSEKYIKPQRQFSDIIIRYFTDEIFPVGDSHYVPAVKLQITLDASVHIESIVMSLSKFNVAIEWDYADDLSTQHLVLKSPVAGEILMAALKETIDNPDELILIPSKWLDGYRGFVQLIILLVISEKLKSGEDLTNV